jgi:deoxyribodipyrimidine photo-lyase
MVRAILWFRQDLRLHDNEALLEAVKNADELIPVYVFDPTLARSGIARIRFLIESITDLRMQLRALGSDLLVRIGHPEEILYQLALDTKSQWVFCNRERTYEEVGVQDRLEQKLWTIGQEIHYCRGKMLYYTSDLPFPVTHCPDSYLSFKKEIVQITPIRLPLPTPESVPPLTDGLDSGQIPDISEWMSNALQHQKSYFKGGESVGLKVLKEPSSHLKPEILAAEGQLISPWISMGCLSPKKVYHDSFLLKEEGEAIRQNLIYRDYLRLMGKKYGDRIFYKSGIRGARINYQSDKSALENWKKGETGIAIIDAAMHQLNQTGWLSDTLRRLVANYFIKVLQLDWRLGAAHFESRLIDYDPCSNWVSWLNVAGLGPDSREERILNFEMAGKKLDPDGTYIKTWIK